MSTRPRVLVTPALLDPAPGLLAARCEIVSPDGAPLTVAATGCAGLVCQYRDTIDEAVLATPGLRVVATIATGTDNIDLAAASRHRVLVGNTAGVLDDAVADHTMALILATARRVVEGDRLVRSGTWSGWALDQLLGAQVSGATLGLVGFGGIARGVARRAAGFRMRVLYTARSRRSPAEEEEWGVEFRPFPELLRASDVVSLHVPLTPDTRHLLGAAELDLLKPGAILVNTSRGPVVDEAALATALGAGRLGGAGLDVFEHEPAVDPRLAACDRAVLTPHVGSGTVGTRAAMCVTAVRNVLAVLAGEAPPRPVNPEVLV